MPVYNAGEFLPAAIESVQAQTFGDWELVIVDDGSTDGSLEVAEKFASTDSRIRVLKMAAPSGSAYQPRKTAIENAAATIVSPLDADDCLEPDSLRLLMERRAETGAAIVYPTMYSFDGVEKHLLLPSEQSVAEAVMPGREAVALTLDGWRINCNGGVIDRSLYLDVFERYDSGLRLMNADEFLTRQLLFHARRVAFSPSVYLYRTNPDSITHRFSMKLFDTLRTDRLLHDFIAAGYSEESDERLLINRQMFHGIFDSMRLLNRMDTTPDERQAIYADMCASASRMDLARLRQSVSPRYYLMFRLLFGHPEWMRKVLKTLDKIL